MKLINKLLLSRNTLENDRIVINDIESPRYSSTFSEIGKYEIPFSKVQIWQLQVQCPIELGTNEILDKKCHDNGLCRGLGRSLRITKNNILINVVCLRWNGLFSLVTVRAWSNCCRQTVDSPLSDNILKCCVMTSDGQLWQLWVEALIQFF